MAGSRPSEDLDAIRRDAKSPGDRAVIREIGKLAPEPLERESWAYSTMEASLK